MSESNRYGYRIFDLLKDGMEISLWDRKTKKTKNYIVTDLVGAGSFSCVYRIADKDNFDKKYLLKTFNPDMTEIISKYYWPNDTVKAACLKYTYNKRNENNKEKNQHSSEFAKYSSEFAKWSDNFDKLIENEKKCGITNNNICEKQFMNSEQYFRCYVLNDLNGKTLAEYNESVQTGEGLAEYIKTIKDMLEIISNLRKGKEDEGVKGIIHFDIKPDNVLVDENGRIISFIDFGSVFIHTDENEYNSFDVQTSINRSDAKTLGYCYDIFCALFIFRNYINNNQIIIADELNDELERLTDPDKLKSGLNIKALDKEKAKDYNDRALLLLNNIYIVNWDKIRQNTKGSNSDLKCNHIEKIDEKIYLKFPHKYDAFAYKCNFYEERKYLINAIAYYYTSKEDEGDKNTNVEIIPVRIEITSEFKNQTEINNYIAEAILGTNVKNGYQILKNYISKYNEENRILLLVNLRCYNIGTIKNTIACLDELCNPRLSYAIFYGELYEKGKEFNVADLIISKKREVTVETYKDKAFNNGNNIKSYYHLEKLRGATISTYQLVTASLGAFDYKKFLGFASLMYSKFSEDSSLGTQKQISIEEIKKPLTEKDVILIAERTGIITVVERGTSHEYLEVIVSNEKMMEDILVDAKMSIILNSPVEEHIKELSEKPMSESYIASIRERISRDNVYDKAAEFYKPYFLNYNINMLGIPTGALTESNIYLSANIYGILQNDENICDEWLDKRIGFPNINLKDYEHSDSHFIELLSSKIDSIKNSEAYKRKCWGYYVLPVVTIALFIVLIFFAGWFLSTQAERELRKEKKQEFINESNISTSFIFKNETISAKVTDENKDNIWKTWFSFKTEQGMEYEASPLDANVSDDKILIDLTMTNPDVDYTLEEPLHITEVEYEAQTDGPYHCDVWIMPDNYRITANITQVPTVVNVDPSEKGHCMECFVSFSLDENAPEDLEMVILSEEELRKYIGLNFDNRANNDGIAPASITLTDTPNTYKVRFEYDNFVDTIFTSSDDVKTSVHVFVNSDAAYVQSGSYPDIKFKALRATNSEKIAVVKSSIPTNNEIMEISYHTKSAANSKNYVVFEPEIWKDGYEIYYDNSTGDKTYLSRKGFSYDGNNINLDTGTVTVFDPEFVAGEESVLTFTASFNNGNGQFSSQESVEIPFDISLNGNDILAPEVYVERIKVTEKENGKYTYKIYITVTDNYPLSKLDDDWSSYISYSGINVGSQSILFTYPENNDDGTYDTTTIRHIITLNDVEFLNQTFFNADGSIDDGGNYSIFIDAEAFQDGAGNFDREHCVLLGDKIQMVYPKDNQNGIDLFMAYPYDTVNIGLSMRTVALRSEFDMEESYRSKQVLHTPYTSISELTGRQFAITGGTGVKIDGVFINFFNCSFGENICVTNAVYENGCVEFDLVFPDNNETIVLDTDMVTLYDEDDNIVEFGSLQTVAHPAENNTRRSYRVWGLNEKIPAKLKISANAGFVPGTDGGGSGEVSIDLNVRND